MVRIMFVSVVVSMNYELEDCRVGFRSYVGGRTLNGSVVGRLNDMTSMPMVGG